MTIMFARCALGVALCLFSLALVAGLGLAPTAVALAAATGAGAHYRHPGPGLDAEHRPHRLLCRQQFGLLPLRRGSSCGSSPTRRPCRTNSWPPARLTSVSRSSPRWPSTRPRVCPSRRSWPSCSTWRASSGYRPGSGIHRPRDLVGQTFAWDGGHRRDRVYRVLDRQGRR